MSAAKKSTPANSSKASHMPTMSNRPMHTDIRSISPSMIPVHQDLIPGSRGESVLANHLYWI